MIRGIPISVILLGLVSFFNDIASEMLYPIMPIFLTQVLGAPVFVIGIIEGVAEGSSAFFKTIFGVWSDRLQRRKPFVFLGYLSSACAKIIIATARFWPTVFLGRFIDRFGKGLRTGARDALLLEVATERNRGFIFGVHRSMDSAGAVVGPIIALLLLQLFNENIRLVLYIATIPSFIGLLFFFFIREAKKQVQTTKTTFSFSFKNLSGNLKLFLIVIAVFSLGNSSDVFLILRSQELGLTLTMVVLIYVLYNLVYTLGSIPAGRIADRIGPKKVFLVGLLIFSFVYFGFAFNKSGQTVWFLFAIYGLYIALTDGVSKAIVGSLISKQEAGTAYGLMQTVISISTLLASIIGGFLWSAISPSATFIFGTVCALSAFILFISFDFKTSKV